MSVAATIGVSDIPRRDSIVRVVVAVHKYGFAHCAAVCTYGWAGGRR
jgi:hypothetical protein